MLVYQLEISEEQVAGIKTIFTDSFGDEGQDLAGNFSLEDSKKISSDLLKNNKEAIVSLLNEEQVAKFNNFLERKK